MPGARAVPLPRNNPELNAEALAWREALDDGPVPEALKGLEGIRTADKVLTDRGAVGMLVGGLLSEIWTKNHISSATLSNHKDVDVLILDPDKYLPVKKWEHGIDWWAEDTYGIISSPGEWAGGGNLVPVTLAYRVESQHDQMALTPGLYIPGREFTREMLSIEAKEYCSRLNMPPDETIRFVQAVENSLSVHAFLDDPTGFAASDVAWLREKLVELNGGPEGRVFKAKSISTRE